MAVMIILNMGIDIFYGDIKMKILELIQANAGQLQKQATTNGVEYTGACPWCGNQDRFSVWPEIGRYWCRTCGKTGDEIQYLIDRRGLSFKEACLLLGRHAGPRKHSPLSAPAWLPAEAKAPREYWQMKARNFLTIAINTLWSKQAEPIRAWLKAEKGLSDATIKKSMLGYTPMDIDEPRCSWGLEPLLKGGTEKSQWIPKGLVIPLIKNNKVIRLRIMRDNPGDEPHYVVISGSSSAPLIIGQNKDAIVIVESELDSWLLSQEAGDLCTVVALGNAQAKPDIETDKLLQDALVILISLDKDDAWAKASWSFWRDNYQAKRWPTIKGKDASEARLKGLDLRTWIITGLFGTEENFERFCIQTIDGGLTDIEAVRKIPFYYPVTPEYYNTPPPAKDIRLISFKE